MESTYQTQMQLPAAYAILSEDEMVYLGGGALVLENITAEDVILFNINLGLSVVRLLGQAALASTVNGLIQMHRDGLTIGQSVSHYWGRQNTFGRAMTFVVAGFVGVDLYFEVLSVINNVLSIYSDIKQAYESDISASAAANAGAVPAAA